MQKNEVLINGGALNAPVVSALAAEQFLTENYCFRRNLLWSSPQSSLTVRHLTIVR